MTTEAAGSLEPMQWQHSQLVSAYPAAKSPPHLFGFNVGQAGAKGTAPVTNEGVALESRLNNTKSIRCLTNPTLALGRERRTVAKSPGNQPA